MENNRSGSLGRWVAMLGVAGIALAACGGNDPSSSSTAATAAPAATEGGETVATDAAADTSALTTAAPVLTNPPVTEPSTDPVSGGKIIVALDAESTGFSPQVDAWGDAGHNVARAIFDTLAVYAPDGSVAPYLAESITANEDATVWTITVRPGITFHNGEVLDAAAVQANFQATLDSPQFGSTLQLIDSMTVIDDLTLEVTMSAPWGPFPNSLTGGFTGQAGYMAAPAMLADPAGGRSPIGTGPFVFQEWVPDDHLTVTRNEDYWQRPAYLDEVEFRPIPDSTSRKGAFDAGDVDVQYTASSADLGEYLAAQEEGDVHVTVSPPANPDVIILNTTVPPLDDIRVRRALAHAIDIDRVIEFVEGTGVKQALHGPYFDDSFWFVDTGYPTYDLAAAQALVEEYEAEVGPIEFEYTGNQDPFVVTYMELFQAMWAEAGIDASIVSKAQADNVSSVLSQDYQVTGWGGIGGDDPDNDYAYFRSGTGLNITGFTSPEIDAAMDAGRALSDPEARKAQYAIVQQVLTDNMPYLWLYSNQFGVITAGDVLGMESFTLPDGSPARPLLSGRFYLNNVWVQQ